MRWFHAVLLTVLVAGSPAQPPVFKSGVESIEVDVVVTDRQGHVVRDLAKNDFQISEDGKRQEVTTFALVDIPLETSDRSSDRGQAIEPDVATNEHVIEGRAYVLLIDDLNMESQAVDRAKEAAKQFIERLGANDLMAVVHTGGTDAASQTFTSNRPRLLAAVDRTTAQGLQAATAVRNENALMSAGRDTGDTFDLERAANAQITLRVLRDVSNWFATVHGRRKAILFMSRGIDYPMTLENRPDQPNRPTDAVLNAAQEAIDAAMRSNVGIYAIDPGGLRSDDDIAKEVFVSPRDQNMGTRGAQRESEMKQDSLRRLSEETGGAAAVSRNDLATAFDKIVADSSTYYVLAYPAPNNKRDGKFHKISVQVNRPRVAIRARSGYRSPSGTAPAAPALDAAGPSRELRDALASPMPAGGLAMRVALAPFRGTAPNASVLMTEDLRGGDLKLIAADTLELSHVAVDPTGKVRAGSNDRLQLTALKPETRAQIERSGLRVFNRLALPPGRYTVRIGAHEVDGGTVGSVAYELDVPDFSAAPLTLSGLVLTSLATGRMEVAKADAQMKDVLPAPPIAVRTFPRSDQIWLFAEIYDNAGDTPHAVTIGTTVTSTTGTVVYKTSAEHPSSEFTGTHGIFRYRARVPLNDLEPGAYVLSVEARTRLGPPGHDETARQQVLIEVTK
jgi:VWFA-related protein